MLFRSSKGTKFSLIIVTILYSILLPFLIQVVAMSWMAFASTSVSKWFALFYLLTFYLVPVSVPIALSIAWYQYAKGHNKKACWFCALPIGVLAGCFVVSALLDLFKVNLM